MGLGEQKDDAGLGQHRGRLAPEATRSSRPGLPAHRRRRFWRGRAVAMLGNRHAGAGHDKEAAVEIFSVPSPSPPVPHDIDRVGRRFDGKHLGAHGCDGAGDLRHASGRARAAPSGKRRSAMLRLARCKMDRTARPPRRVQAPSCAPSPMQGCGKPSIRRWSLSCRLGAKSRRASRKFPRVRWPCSRGDAFGMKLHAMHGMGLVHHALDHAVLGGRR